MIPADKILSKYLSAWLKFLELPKSVLHIDQRLQGKARRGDEASRGCETARRTEAARRRGEEKERRRGEAATGELCFGMGFATRTVKKMMRQGEVA
ncbi:hypothetical protein U1Q18_037565 [Sarracenia purpurea var. burkii]